MAKLTRTEVHARLERLKAKSLPRPQVDQVFEIKGEFPEEDRQVLQAYLDKFCWVEGNKCPSCDTELGGITGSFCWDLTHGEGHCGVCTYPVRYYHYNVGPIQKLRYFLPYHPDNLTTKS